VILNFLQNVFKQINNYRKRIADFGKRFLEFLKKRQIGWCIFKSTNRNRNDN